MTRSFAGDRMSSHTPDETDESDGAESDRTRRGPAASADHDSCRAGRDRCPACGGDTLTDAERGETVCSECGLVVDETVLDTRPPRRHGESAVSRVGPPTTPRYHDGGLGTVIGPDDADETGPSSTRKRRQVERLRTWNRRSLTHAPGDRSLQFGLGELERMASALSVPEDVREMASVVFRRAHEAGVQRGRSLEATATAALFAALRYADVPVTLADVSDLSRVDRADCRRTYRDVVRELSLEIGPPDPVTHVSRIASGLDVGDDLERLARSILKRAKTAGDHVGKHPAGQAAAALYAASLIEDADYTQQEIGSEADVSPLTIREHYGTMLAAWRDGEG